MSEQKPIPAAEVSLKYMAWDVKGMANAMEAILKLIQARSGSSYAQSEETPF